ncbi:MAG TPA: HEAT repeat domain-containing protein [Phycisphaerae bacterium]|nr:HEAT repeat domain-containing protein [Phycisphaerae bacterium]
MRARRSCLCLALLFASLAAGCSAAGRGRVRTAADVEELVARLGHSRWRVRAAAAQSLGDARDIRALWPLTLAAATDPHPRVRRAAAEALTWVGLDPDSDMVRACRKRLMMGLASVQFDNVSLEEAFGTLARAGGMSLHVDWGSLELIGVLPDETKITVDARDLTLAEAWCRVLVATGTKAAFIIDTDYPVHVASVESLTDHVKGAHSLRRRRAELRRLAEGTVEGRAVLGKLQRRLPEARIWNVECSRVLDWIGRSADLQITTDWGALNSVGIDESTARWNLHLKAVSVEKLLWVVLDDLGGATPLEFIVKDGGVFISTRAEIDKWLAAQRGNSKSLSE